MKAIWRGRGILGLVALGVFTPAAWGGYTFVNIADSSGEFDTFHLPALNASGHAAFGATRDDGSSGIFRGNGGALTTITDSSGELGTAFSNTSINAAGAVCFVANIDAGGKGVFKGSGGALTPIADIAGPFSNFFGTPSIDTAGNVFFFAGYDANAGAGVFTGNGGAVNTMYDTPTSPFANIGANARMSSTGRAAIIAQPDAGGNGIFTGDGGATTTIADFNGPFNSFFPFIDINASGRVAFLAAKLGNGGGGAIFTGDGGQPVEVANDAGPIFQFGNGPSINASGEVAFVASLDANAGGGFELFTGPDPVADKVIQTGDTLFGSTLTGISFVPGALNDDGSLAFLYFLEDGRNGIARADPVPEPSIALSAIGLAAMGLARRRRGITSD